MRTKKAPVRDISPDSKYGSVQVAKLINRVMRSGKKSVAQKQVYRALDIVEERTKRKPVDVFIEVIGKISPQMEVRSRRVGGASYQVPMPVRGRRSFSLALRWLILEANKRSNKDHHTFADKLSSEILDVLNDQGGALQKRETAHRMAESNKAFSHFRW